MFFNLMSLACDQSRLIAFQVVLLLSRELHHSAIWLIRLEMVISVMIALSLTALVFNGLFQSKCKWSSDMPSADIITLNSSPSLTTVLPLTVVDEFKLNLVQLSTF
jgi:hypothetical protein